MSSSSESSIVHDGRKAISLVANVSWRRLLTAWIYVPTGIFAILLCCFGFSKLIVLTPLSFPASVVSMLLLFATLVICDVTMGEKGMGQLVSIIEIPTEFCLRYINLFFTPSFVVLPLSSAIGAEEVAKIAAIFVTGFVFVMVVTASMVRLLQLILGSSKPASRKTRETNPIALSTAAVITRSNDVVIRGPDNSQLTLPFSDQSVQRPPSIALSHRDLEMSYSVLALQPLRRDTHSHELGPFSRSERWAAMLNKNLDRIIYLILFLVVGLPVYYATGYAAPAQLTFSVLAYFIAMSIPEGWKRVLHPVLVSSAITILGLWVLGLPLSSNLHSTLSHYKTNAKYLQIWSGSKKLPGAGDIFASILDASIVALALPMFHFRKELYRHFIFILIPNVTISAASLFGYPAVCYAVKISSSRSISFAVRSLTLALATPAATSLGGDLDTAASLAIASGIFGVLICEYLFRLLRISQEDFVTRGVTVGGTSSAIGTAMLLTKDPRAAALSSLSMGLFGTVTVLLTSIPPVVKLVQSLVHEEA